MGKYWQVFKITWQQYLIYRVNFVLWRFRTVFQLLLVYYIWWSVFQPQKQLFGYTTYSIMTYILVAALTRAIILGTRVTDLIDSINTGRVVNFLMKPLGFTRYFIVRDIADKVFNIGFFVAEISLLIFLLKPPLLIQTESLSLTLFFLAIIGGLIINFCLNFIISLTSFWVENSWGVLFLMSILLEGLGGSLFPLDILPKGLFNLVMLTPFPYLVYFPAKLYLGKMAYSEILLGFALILMWVFVLVLLTKMMVNAGFRHFSAEGD